MQKIGNSFFIREKMLTIFGGNLEIWAVQKYVNLPKTHKCKSCRSRQELSSFTHFCTAPNSKSQLNFVKHFRNFSTKYLYSQNVTLSFLQLFKYWCQQFTHFEEFVPECQQFLRKKSRSPRFLNWTFHDNSQNSA